MIYTINLNPAIDKTVYVDTFEVGGTNRPTEVREQGGGKALNVSIILKNLGIESHMAGYVGKGNEAPILAALNGIPHTLVTLPKPARTNLKIVDLATRVTTEVNESGPFVDTAHKDALEAQLDGLLTAEDTVVLTGSLPPGLPEDYYAQLMKRYPAKFVLDTSGPAIVAAVAEKPYLIKPNQDELTQLTGKSYTTTEEIVHDCKALIAGGVGICVVTLGKDGSLIVDENDAYFASAVVEHPDSTVGAGDSLLAGVLCGLSTGKTIGEALALGTAAAAATISRPGTDMGEKAEIEAYYNKIEPKQL